MAVLREPMRTVSVKLPRSLDRSLSNLSKQRKTTRSILFREAIEAYVSTPTQSVTEAAGSLVGSLDGVHDLSTGKHHMAGYGR